MEKYFVPYEEALELKELGFDEDVIATYETEDKTLSIFAFSVPNKGVFEEGFKQGWCIKAPIYNQVFEWFKEKHGIQVFFDYIFYDGFHYGFKWTKSDGTYGEVWDCDDEFFSGWESMEDVELGCLRYLINRFM